uniref:hypothetical protein n=1 Tax=Streptomyces sp. NRRL B-24572 TaxID=1962156 RepID=UPI001C4EEFED
MDAAETAALDAPRTEPPDEPPSTAPLTPAGHEIRRTLRDLLAEHAGPRGRRRSPRGWRWRRGSHGARRARP